MRSNRLAAVGLASAAAVALVACSPGQVPASESEGEISGRVSMLTPLFSSDASKEAFEVALEGFYEKYPDVTVEVDYTDYSKLNEKVTTGLASGLLPDVVQIGGGWIPPLADKGVILPLEEAGVPAEQLSELFPEAALRYGVHDGETYALPFVTGGLQGVYRKDYFEEAGLDPELPPATWDELRDAAIATTVRGADGTLERAGFTAITDNLRQNFTTFLYANGGQPFSADGTETTLNSPEGEEALEFLHDLVHEDRVVDIGFESGSPQHPILSGKAAIALYGNYIPCDNPDIVDPAICEELGFFAIPGSEEGESAVLLGGTLSAITSGAKNPEAAAALVEYLAEEPEVAFATAAQVYSVPSAVAAWEDPRVTEVLASAHFLSVIDSAGVEGGPVTWLDTRNDFQPALESVINGGAGAKSALDDLAARADAAIAAAQ